MTRCSFPLAFQPCKNLFQKSSQNLKSPLCSPCQGLLHQAYVWDWMCYRALLIFGHCTNISNVHKSHIFSFSLKHTGLLSLHCTLLIQTQRTHKQLSHACRAQRKSRTIKGATSLEMMEGTSGVWLTVWANVIIYWHLALQCPPSTKTQQCHQVQLLKSDVSGK